MSVNIHSFPTNVYVYENLYYSFDNNRHDRSCREKAIKPQTKVYEFFFKLVIKSLIYISYLQKNMISKEVEENIHSPD